MKKNDNKNFPVDESLHDDELNENSGGYIGIWVAKDFYSQEDYNKAGVTQQKNIWSKDKYLYKGEKITQREADMITYTYFNDPYKDLAKRLPFYNK